MKQKTFLMISIVKSQRAFSLIEMMTVLSIIAILAAISIPLLRDTWNHVNQKIMLDELLRTIQLAKREARIRHQAIGLCKSDTGSQCVGEWRDGQIIFVDINNDGSVHDPSQILKIIHGRIKHGILFWRSFPAYRDYLQFLPNGLLQHDNGTFWYCDDNNSSPVWAITLSKTGKTRVLYPENGVIKDASGRALAC